MNNLNEFLVYMHGEKESVIKSFSNNRMKTIKPEEIEHENTFGDIYFVVNSGGDKDNVIKNYNAVFIDLDCGRNVNKEYQSLDIVKNYKDKKIKELSEFMIKPSLIIETRNGLHVYWMLDGNCDVEQWKACILKLIRKFGGDKVVNNPARLMRLPYTKWMKDINNPFDINVIECNEVHYSIDYILSHLTDIVVDAIDARENCGYSIMKFKDTYNTISTKTLPLIIDGEFGALQSVLNVEPRLMHTENEFYNYITKSINLNDFLGVHGTSFNCIFHEDKNPSAGIFISERGQYFYKCHSPKCGFKGNIIRCVERIRNCKTRPEAINFIKKVFQLSIEDTEWQRKQKMILEENKRMIREGEFEEYYPDVYNLIKKYLDLIYLMHDVAIDNVYDEKLTDDEDNVVFFTSVTSISEMLNYKGRAKISDRNSLFAFLKLINKLPDNQIPESYLKKAKQIRIQNNQHFKVNFFSIPSYCDNQLEESDKRAALYKGKNLTMRGWSRELLQRTFGDDITNEVYPQFVKRKLSSASNSKTSEIHKLTIKLIDDKGYVLEKEIVEILRDIFGKVNTESQIKKSLQEMLESYTLERIRATKIIKEQFGIAGNGYPFIIVKKQQ